MVQKDKTVELQEAAWFIQRSEVCWQVVYLMSWVRGQHEIMKIQTSLTLEVVLSIY